MAKFDAAKDVTIAAETFPDDKGGIIEVKAARYGDGEPKIQFTRWRGGEDEEHKPAKLGRVTLREAYNINARIDILLDVLHWSPDEHE